MNPQIRCAHSRVAKIKDLKLNPDNRNIHPREQIQRLAEILKYQGFRYCVKVSKQSGVVTSGHGRIEAALLNGWDEVPVDDQHYDTPEQEYADTISDNAIASWSELNLSGINQDLTLHGPELKMDMLGIRNFALDPYNKEVEVKELDETRATEECPSCGYQWSKTKVQNG